MKEIQLTQGQVAIVCDCHAHLVEGHKWYAAFHKKINSYYAMRKLSVVERAIKGKWNTSMHETIAGTPKGFVTHHDNHHTLDNRCTNLIVVTDTANKQKRRDSASGYIGVTFHKRSGKWVAQIQSNHVHKEIGQFTNPEQAARAYDEKARELFGDNCFTNFAT